MFKLITFAIVALIALDANTVVRGDNNFEPVYSIVKAYDKVNNYLVKYVKTGGVRVNLDAAISWLGKKVSGSDHGFNQALTQLKALKNLERQKKCNQEDHDIVLINNLAVANNKILYKIENPLAEPRKIDLIVREFTIGHAKECLPAYRSAFRTRYKQINQAKEIKIVEEFTNGFLNARGKSYLSISRTYEWIAYERDQLKSDFKELYRDKLHDLMTTTHLSGLVLFEALKHLAKSDQEVKYLRPVEHGRQDKTLVVEKEEVQKLFESYILKPCQFYLQQLGPQVLEVASCDEKNLGSLKNDKKTVLDHKEFYLAIFSFELCSQVVDEQIELSSDLVQVVSETK